VDVRLQFVGGVRQHGRPVVDEPGVELVSGETVQGRLRLVAVVPVDART